MQLQKVWVSGLSDLMCFINPWFLLFVGLFHSIDLHMNWWGF